ncbi:MAG TPA: M48 family metallopeptidase [Sulfuricaulis sp.]|nr:M48 family metallopeptidase [Sulfuricaulis sp.]
MELIYRKEKLLFGIAVLISAVFWLVLVGATMGIALLYVLMFFVFYLFAQSAFISYVRGTAVKITPQQFPDLQQRVAACSNKLGMKNVPDVYLLHADGAFNALATRFLGRDFVVLFSDVVDAFEAQPGAVNFYIGHEMGHIHRKHLLWGPLLAPALLLPLLGAAYSRAREYTCDRYGLACCENPQDATTGLAALAAGGRRWRILSKENYAGQAKESSGFWMSFHELVSDYPWLVKRMTALNALITKQKAAIPSRSNFAFFLALFVPRLGVGGGGASVLVFVAIIGILAAIAIPAYQDYTVRANMMGATPYIEKAKTSVMNYAVKNQTWPNSNTDAGVPEVGDNGPVIKSIQIKEGGAVVVTFAKGPVANHNIVYKPYVKDQRIYWECSGEDLPAKYLPGNCR